jgi:CubicO group peptidase (beta-lactamase class C family)
MNVIGASSTWQWVPYTNSYVDVDGKRMASVSGGTRWGGGMWINALDMARFGYLWLRNGRWGDKQILPPAYVKTALTPSAHGPTIFVSPDHDLVIVWRWHGGGKDQFFRQVIDAINAPTQ